MMMNQPQQAPPASPGGQPAPAPQQAAAPGKVITIAQSPNGGFIVECAGKPPQQVGSPEEALAYVQQELAPAAPQGENPMADRKSAQREQAIGAVKESYGG